MIKSRHKTQYIFLTLLILTFSRVPVCSSELYLLPQDSTKALSTILESIDHSKKSIKIMIYNFTHKKIAKRLKIAAKRGVKVEIVFDQKNSHSDKRRSMLYYLAKYKNILIYKLRGKYIKQQKRYGIMHLKSAVFDHRRVIFGSANWTYSAFGKNYEMLYVEDNYGKAKQFEKYFQILKKESIPFK